jgi:hypothetical protein
LRPSLLVTAAADEAAGEFTGAPFIVPGGNSRPDRHAQVSEFRRLSALELVRTLSARRYPIRDLRA